MAQLPADELLGGGLELLKQLAQDSQDSVRLLAAEELVPFGKIFNEEQNRNLLLPIFSALAEDRSWRVRYMVASEYVEVRCHLLLTCRKRVSTSLNSLDRSHKHLVLLLLRNISQSHSYTFWLILKVKFALLLLVVLLVSHFIMFVKNYH